MRQQSSRLDGKIGSPIGSAAKAEGTLQPGSPHEQAVAAQHALHKEGSGRSQGREGTIFKVGLFI